MPNLTKPQARLLLKVMRNDGGVAVDRSGYRVATNLADKGYLCRGDSGLFYETRQGLSALLYYWACKDAASGCRAFALTRQEVEDAFAARFPEPLKQAA